jgi:3-mercaptopyruvate sulfurtransferase SseA
MKKGPGKRLSVSSVLKIAGVVGVLGLGFALFSKGFSYGDPEFLMLERELQIPTVKPETLQGWIASGYKHPFGYPVVIVDTSAQGYEAGHIPGAVNIPVAEFSELRSDGPVLVEPMVASGERLDGLLKRMGVRSQETLIVFTSNAPTTDDTVVRPFWTLHYWGFKPRYVKVLNGGNAAFKEAGFDLEQGAVNPSPGILSVRNVNDPGQMEASRKSIGDMLRLIDEGKTKDGSVQVVYALQPNLPLAGTRDRITRTAFDDLKVYFSGRIVGAKQLMFGRDNLFNEDGTFKSQEELLTLFQGVGLDPQKPTVAYCNRGNVASLYWFAMKFVAGFKDVAVYDGSWSEWGKLSAYQPTPRAPYVLQDGTAEGFLRGYDPQRKVFLDSFGKEQTVPNEFLAFGGVLEGNTAWDTVSRSELIVFNPEAAVPEPFPEPYTVYPEYLGSGDEIENDDRNYLLSGGGTTAAPQEPTPAALQPVIGAGGGC